MISALVGKIVHETVLSGIIPNEMKLYLMLMDLTIYVMAALHNT